jgi:hypothetical protein
MKGRTLWAVIVAALVAVVGLTWFLWPRHTEGPLFRLKVVRQTTERGRPVMFFRVEVADHRPSQIGGIRMIKRWSVPRLAN